FLSLFIMVCCVAYGMEKQGYAGVGPETSPTTPFIYNPTNFWGFDTLKWGYVVSSCVFSQVMHHSVPTLIQPVKNKSGKSIKHINYMFMGVFGSTALFYSLVGGICGTFFGENANSLVTLNWEFWDGLNWMKEQGTGERPIYISFIVHLIILFPAVAIISSAPLNAITLSNQIEELVPKDKWVSMDSKTKARVKMAIRLSTIVVPIVMSLFVRCLEVIIEVCGLTGFLICYLFPPLLEWKARRECKKVFGEGEEANNTGLGFWAHADPMCIFLWVTGLVCFIFTSISLVSGLME
ncbi:hypothetical protein KIPB_008907, partial [Kipferlia bialata]